MNPVIQEKETITVVGVSGQHVMPDNGVIHTIAEQWERFMPRIGEIEHRDAATLGICCGVPGAAPFDYVTGAQVTQQPENVPNGMTVLRLMPQRYARFTHRGPIAGLGATYAAIEAWLAENGQYVRAQAPDFEYYDQRYTGFDAAESEFEIYVPVIRA